MTEFYVKGVYHELTLYIDLYKNKLIDHSMSRKRDDSKIYYESMRQVLKKRIEDPNLDMTLH